MVLNSTANQREKEEFLQWIETAGQDVAIEFFFQKGSDEIFFFGLRIESLTKNEQVNFVRELTGKLKKSDFETVLTTLRLKLQDESILSEKPVFLEVGMEGFWKSQNPCVVWRAGETPLTTEELSQKAPHLTGSFHRAIMMEAAWKNPLPLWLAQQICEHNDDEYAFSPAKYETLTETLT